MHVIRLLFAAAIVLLFLSSWIYLPAPNRTFLTLGVGAPEISAWLALAGLVVFGARLDSQLRAAGAISIFLEIPWAEHAFDLITNGPSGQLSLYYTERFLSWALTRRPPTV